MKTVENVIKSFLLGAILGTTYGLLYAPRAGCVTRSKLKRLKFNLQDELKYKIHKTIESLKVKFDITSAQAQKYLSIEQAINNKIVHILLKLQNECPEVYKVVDEMPNTLYNNSDPELSLHSLNNYYDSLVELHKNYIASKG